MHWFAACSAGEPTSTRSVGRAGPPANPATRQLAPTRGAPASAKRRDEYYNKESADKDLAEVIIGKQRDGPTDTLKLTFLGRYTTFENHAPNGYAGSFE